MPRPISSAYSPSLTATNRPPSPMAVSSQYRVARLSLARAAFVARAAAQPLVTSTIVFNPAPPARPQQNGVKPGGPGIKRRLPRREHGGMDRAGDREGTEKQTEGGEFAEDQHPDHGIAGKIVQNSPTRSLWFAIG